MGTNQIMVSSKEYGQKQNHTVKSHETFAKKQNSTQKRMEDDEMNRKITWITLILVMVLICSGCINIPPKTSAPSASIAVMDTPAPSISLAVTETLAGSNAPTKTSTPKPSVTPETTLPPGASIPAGDEGTQEREAFKKMKVKSGEWTYYADWKRMFHIEDGYDCPIKRIKNDGSSDTDLGITGFEFILAGKYIYVNKNLVFGDFGHWDTVRMDLDGGNKKQMEYEAMDIKVYGERIYFVLFNESVLYAADSACEQVKKYDITVPDQQAIKDKMKDIFSIYKLRIKDVKDGWIYFYYGLLDTDTMPFYEGNYRVNLDGTKVEKTDKGTFNEDRIK